MYSAKATAASPVDHSSSTIPSISSASLQARSFDERSIVSSDRYDLTSKEGDREEAARAPLGINRIDRDGSEDGVGSRGPPPDERLKPNPNTSSYQRSRHPSTKWWDALTTFFNDWWLLELLAVLLSFAAMAAIISLLLQYRDHPLREWPYRVTINTLVSFLNSLAKGALLLVTAQVISQCKWVWFHQSKPRDLYDMQLLDDASRGPLGALQLLLYAPKLTLATLSGLIIFLSFAMDPFAQQILSLSQRSVPGQLATIGTVQNYVAQPFTENQADGTVVPDSIGGSLEGTLLKAVYSGVFGEPTSLNFDCVSGNCTWPSFASLSVCTKCANGVGHRIPNFNKEKAQYISPSNITWTFNIIDSLDKPYISAFDSYEDTSLAGIWQPFAGFVRFSSRFDSDPTSEEAVAVEDTAVAECALYFCVQTFKVEANSGTLSVEAFNPWYDETGGACSNHYLTPPDGYDPQGSVLNYTFNCISLSEYFWTQFTRSENSTEESDLLLQLSLTENITEMVSHIGQSLTAALMNAGDRKQQGTSFTTEVFIQVHWPWIILPAMLVLSAAATPLLMMFQTWRNKMAIWKTCNLALVFHSAELSDGESSVYNSATEMNKKARSIKTELVSRDMKWQFIRR